MQYFSLRTTSNRWAAHWLINPSPPFDCIARPWVKPVMSSSMCEGRERDTSPIFIYASGWPVRLLTETQLALLLPLWGGWRFWTVKPQSSQHTYTLHVHFVSLSFSCVDRTGFLGTLLRLHQSPDWHYLFYRIGWLSVSLSQARSSFLKLMMLHETISTASIAPIDSHSWTFISKLT